MREKHNETLDVSMQRYFAKGIPINGCSATSPSTHGGLVASLNVSILLPVLASALHVEENEPPYRQWPAEHRLFGQTFSGSQGTSQKDTSLLFVMSLADSKIRVASCGDLRGGLGTLI